MTVHDLPVGCVMDLWADRCSQVVLDGLKWEVIAACLCWPLLLSVLALLKLEVLLGA